MFAPVVTRAAPPPQGIDRYQLTRILGSGTFGVVHAAIDRVTGRPVAVKQLTRLDPAALRRFKQEFRSFVDIDHPNVLRLHALLADQRGWFVVMELVDGTDLLTALRGSADAQPHGTLVTVDEDLPSPLARALPSASASPTPSATPVDGAHLRHLFRQLAAGVAALHSAGRLHCDIKPSNVLVDRSGRVVLVDFGLASALGTSGDAASRARAASPGLRGTPAYMSPEQVVSSPLTPASDWYALGVMLYEALTGALPFGGSEQDMLRARLEATPRDPRLVAPRAGVPEDLAALAMALLARQPEARPRAHEILQTLAAGAEQAPPPEPPFVGRSATLEALLDAFARSRARPLHVRIEAPPGLGKTTLLRQLEGRLPADAALLSGRCFEHESVPFKSIDPLVDELAAWLWAQPEAERATLVPSSASALARLFPVLAVLARALGSAPEDEPEADADKHERRRRALAAWRALIAGVAARHALVVILDDVHWGDADGARVLGEALAAAPSGLLVTTSRHDLHDGVFLAALADAAPGLATEVLTLAPLHDDEARALARTLVADPEVVETVVREAGGQPLFLVELARRAAFARGGDVISLDAVIAERVRRLPASARLLLELLAIGGRPMPAGLVAAVAELDAGAADDALRTLQRERLVRRRPGPEERLEWAHERVCATALAGVASDTRTRVHQRIAERLEAGPLPDAEALAWHWAAAGVGARAATWAERAAVHATDSLAFERAAELYRDALAHALPEDRRRLHLGLAEALALAGRDADSAAAYRDALAGAPERERPEIERRLAEQYLRAGHLAEGLVALTPVLARADVRLPRTTLGAITTLIAEDLRLLLRGARFTLTPEAAVAPALLHKIDANWAAAQGLSNVDIIRGIGFVLRHARLALVAGEPRRLVRGLGMAAMFLAGTGGRRLARAVRYLEALRGLAEHAQDPVSRAWAGIGAGMVDFARLDWRRAHAVFETVLAEITRDPRGLGWELGTAQYFVTLLRQTTGDFRGVLADVGEWADDASDRGDRYTATMLRTAYVPWVELCLDRPQRARAIARDALERWPGDRFLLPHLNALGLTIESLLYEDRVAEALALLDEKWRTLVRSRLLTIEVLAMRVRDMRARAAACLALRGDRQALRRARADVAWLHARRRDWPSAMACAIESALAAAVGDRPGQEAALARAEAGFASVGMRGHAAFIALERDRLADRPSPAAAALRAEGIVAPERLRALYVPVGP